MTRMLAILTLSRGGSGSGKIHILKPLSIMAGPRATESADPADPLANTRKNNKEAVFKSPNRQEQ